ncbi:MAG: hypothetical protein E7355_03295 [Clostridiales bacterium]|nr:hypothetical protein [Clostridiales bacterium]
MKKSNKILVFVSLALVFGLLTTILFLTVPDARLDSKVFWLAFAFAIPVNFVAATAIHIWASVKGNGVVRMPIAYALVAVFAAAYLIVGFIFMYLPVNKTTLPLILLLIITVAYAIAAIYFLRAGDYIVKSEAATKKKVLYIRLLQASVEDCISKTTDAQTRKELSTFAENVRFSDPMSHESLTSIEMEIMNTVDKIAAAIGGGETESVSALIKQAQEQLESRNRRCLLLK